MWSILATTEKWISDVLGDEKESASGGQSKNNPYTRKEVNYVCELGDEDALVTAGIWRRLKEARAFGVTHGQTQEEMISEQGMFLDRYGEQWPSCIVLHRVAPCSLLIDIFFFFFFPFVLPVCFVALLIAACAGRPIQSIL